MTKSLFLVQRLVLALQRNHLRLALVLEPRYRLLVRGCCRPLLALQRLHLPLQLCDLSVIGLALRCCGVSTVCCSLCFSLSNASHSACIDRLSFSRAAALRSNSAFSAISAATLRSRAAIFFLEPLPGVDSASLCVRQCVVSFIAHAANTVFNLEQLCVLCFHLLLALQLCHLRLSE